MGTSGRDFTAVLPELRARFDVLTVDLPGVRSSAHLEQRPTVAALTDAVEHTLDAEGVGRVHVLGNSLGARIALELAVRGRARSVVAIAPSGLNLPLERVYQGAVMASARALMRPIRPLIGLAARSRLGRSPGRGGVRPAPWPLGADEVRAVQDGFAGSTDFWRLLWWAVLADVPLGLEEIDCPVLLAQGTADLISGGQTPRYLALVPRSRFRPLVGAGHAPQSDAPGAILRLVREATRAAGPARRTTVGPVAA